MSTTRISFAGTLLMLICCAAPARAVEVEAAQWGYDGKIVLQKFNLLSVLMSNPTAEPFEGSIQLRQGFAGNERVGAILEEPLFLSPGTSRWVQFYPYVGDHFEKWSLRWGRGERNTYRFDEQLPAGRPARVLLNESDGSLDRGGAVRRFSENLFPPMVTATDTLETVVLDHVPRWEEARRVAFHDWLLRGGTLHLLHGPEGTYPQFTAELAELNTPLDSFRVGAGSVRRHPRMRASLDLTFLKDVLLENSPADAAPAEITAGVPGVPPPPIPGAVPALPSGFPNTQDEVFQDLATGFFNQLKLMTRADHNWPVIYAMSLVYMALIFPGCYLLGFKRKDYRLVYGALLATVIVFSLGFSFVGRRGYGEATVVHSVAVAQHLSGDHFDVTGWSNIFVTGGDDYVIDQAGWGALYSACQHLEAVNGVIKNGPGGRFVVDIPPYSSRPYSHRIKATAPAWKFAVEEFEGGAVLQKFAATADRPLDGIEAISPVYGLYRDRIYRFEIKGNRLELSNGSGLPVASYVGTIDSNAFGQLSYYYTAFAEEQPAEVRFGNMHKPLVLQSLSLNSRAAAATYSLPEDRVRLFLFAPMPPSFHIRDPRFNRQIGQVLYAIDVFQPEKQ